MPLEGSWIRTITLTICQVGTSQKLQTFSEIRLETRIKLNLFSHCSDHIAVETREAKIFSTI